MELGLLIVGPKYVENLGFCLRTSELADVKPVYVYDEYSLLTDAQRPKLMNFSARAIRNHDVRPIDDPVEFLRADEQYRKIGTVVRDDVPVLFDFQYGPNDLVIFGDEHSGLEDEILEECDELVTIPQFNRKHKKAGKIQCYTLVSAVDMFVYEFMRQRFVTNNRLITDGKV